MTIIKAIVHNGQIEVEDRIDLPDGTELLIPIPDRTTALGMREEDWSNSPEAIEAWLRWYDSLEPLDFTPQERAAWEAARRDQKAYELAQWENHSRRIEERFP